MAAFGDYKSTFWQLFSKNNSLTIHHCNPLKLATEAFNMKIGMAPVIMNVFDILIILLETRHNSDQKNTQTTKSNTKTDSRIAPTIWNLLSNECEMTSTLEEFKFKIKKCRSSSSEVFLGKGVLKICSKFTGEHPCWSAISIKLLCNFIEIGLRHGCSPVNSLNIFRTSFPKSTSGGLLLKVDHWKLLY